MHPILVRIPLPWGGTLPLYSYGVMLGLSFIVGWYLTLGLAEREGLPREIMANCYVVTALSAVVASRLLFVVTNLESFDSIGEVFEVRSGGMVAYGGFLGGFLGSWAYLRWKGLPLIPWADVAVPSLASGLLITRIGCYLYGCDFGRPLSDGAPAFLKKLGTFPRWGEEIADASAGSPAWTQHLAEGRIDAESTASLPVHPTQLYESLLGAALLAMLLVARRYQRFRGQIFLYFTFAYGVARFSLEFLRDDRERGDIPPALEPHILFTVCMLIFGAAFAVGIAPAIRNRGLQIAAQVAAFVPALLVAKAFWPEAFQVTAQVRLSTSQFIGLASAVAAAAGFALLYRNALENPKGAMALPVVAVAGAATFEDVPAAPKPTKAAKRPAPPKPLLAEPTEPEAPAALDAAAVAKKKKKKKKAAAPPKDDDAT